MFLYFLSETDNGSCGRIRFLWLTREPEYDEIIADFANFDVASFDELVFCGFGEPTERIDVLLKVARYFKETYHKPIPYQYQRSRQSCQWPRHCTGFQRTD